MKQLSSEQQDRLDLLYAMLESQYAGLRHWAKLQRDAIRIGADMAMRLSDAQIITLSANLAPLWGEITSIMAPPPAPETKPEDKAAPEPPKETVQ